MQNWRVSGIYGLKYYETREEAQIAASFDVNAIVECYIWGIGWTSKVLLPPCEKTMPTLHFDHRNGMGKITDGDFIHAPAYLLGAQDHEVPELMEHGWLIDEWHQPRRMFQTRSTRLPVPSEIAEPQPPIGIHVQLVDDLQWHQKEIRAVYKKYRQHKGFSSHLPIDKTVSMLDRDRKVMISMRNDLGKLIAFTIVRLHSPAFESIQFCWDYENPKLELGHLSQEFELHYASKLGCKWVYLGPAYETTCLYKAKIPGIQWWDGSKWSKDAAELERLLHRDSNTQTIAELMNEHDSA